MAWYNKYRPTSFEQVVGQTLTKEILENSLKNKVIKHCYLFAGFKGIGKTTLARIFANELNQVKTKKDAVIDIIELDAASNTGVDNIRMLIENAQVPPLYGSYKVYIIDEVHMLSKSSMNALLKILEEPPKYLVFLLATTNPEKLLPTVLSRVTRFNLDNHSTQDIINQLKMIAETENMNIDQESLELIAKRSGGSLRDSINLLETIYSYNLPKFDLINTRKILGLLTTEILANLKNKILTDNINSQDLLELERLGIDGKNFLNQFLDYLLEESFQNKETNPQLIINCSNLITQKLPNDNILVAIGLLQNLQRMSNNKNASTQQKTEINNNLDSQFKNDKILNNFNDLQNTDSNNIKEINTKKTIKNDQEKIKEILIKEEKEEKLDIKEEINLKSKDILENLDEQNDLNIKDKNDFNISNFFKNIKEDSKTPTILKLVLPDIEITVNDDNINFSVSNQVFLAQLQSEVVQKFLLEKIQQLGFTKNVICSLKNNNLSNQLNKQKENIEEKKKEKDLIKKIKKNKKEEKYFYKIYKELPENMENSEIKIFNKNIKPIFNKDDNKENWENDALNIFG